MEPSEIPSTDSGYPTPREDLPLSSRSDSPPSSSEVPMTSTPLRGKQRHPIRDPLGPRSNSLSHDLSIIAETEPTVEVLKGVKNLLNLAKIAKANDRRNAALVDENNTLRGENASLREENCTLREETRRIELENASIRRSDDEDDNVFPPIVPKLNLHGVNEQTTMKLDDLVISKDIKIEPISFISPKDTKPEHMLSLDDKKQFPQVITATIRVDTAKMDADVQTDTDNHVNVIESNWKIEVDQLHSKLEVTEKKNTELNDRLFNYEQVKAKFEEDKEKLRSDLEKKLQVSQEKVIRYEGKIEELELRLSKKRKEYEEVSAENRKLLEDRETHEFETDELKVRLEDTENKLKGSEKKVEQLTKEIRRLEEELEAENEAKIVVEQEKESAKKEFEKEVERLKRKVDEAVGKEQEALDQLAEVQAEMAKMVKENKYLSDSQQVLLDSEMNLKTETTVMQATLRNAEQQLQMVQKDLVEERRRREQADAEILDLGLTNQQLRDEKRDSEELLKELKDGKLEIDYLRQKLQFASEESDESRQLRQQFEQSQKIRLELEEKLAAAERKEEEYTAKHEDYIRLIAAKDVELERLNQEVSAQRKRIDSFAIDGEKTAKIISDLQIALQNLDHEYNDFKMHANMQYDHQIGQRDEQIAHLHQRLVELETYPGQTISVSKRNAEIQTDEDEEDVRSEVTLMSEHHLSLEKNIKKLIERMDQYIGGRSISTLPLSFQEEPGSEYQRAETFRQIVELLHDLLDGSEFAPFKKIDNFWEDLKKRDEFQESIFVGKMDKEKRAAAEEFQRIEDFYEKKTKELKDKLQAVQKVSDQRLYLADEFRAEYEFELNEKEEQLAKLKELEELRDQDRVEWEQSNKDLRDRLEAAQHMQQQYARERIGRTDAHEEELEELRNGFQKAEKELKFRVKMAEDELRSEKAKRDYDRASMSKMRKDFDVVVEKLQYLKLRNSERQKMLNDVRSVLIKCQQSTDPNQTMVFVTKINDKLNKSNLLTRNNPYESPSTGSSQHSDENRPVLNELHQQK